MRAPGLLVALMLLFAQPGAWADGAMVASVSVDEARAAFIAAGLPEPTERTIDPDFPTLGSSYDGFGVQATLQACNDSTGRCRGVELLALMPSTSVANARIIEGSIERSVLGFGARLVQSGDTPVVAIGTYLLYDYGISEEMLPVMLAQLVDIVVRTKGFMLSDDPGHATLWQGRKDGD